MIGRVDELVDEEWILGGNPECFYIPRPTIPNLNNPFRDPSSHAEYPVLWHQRRCDTPQLDALGITGRVNRVNSLGDPACGKCRYLLDAEL